MTEDKIKELRSFAEFAITKEKENRMHSVSVDRKSTSCPYISFLIKDDGLFIVVPPEWREEWGNIKVADRRINEKDVFALWLRLTASVLKAEAHLMIVEAYSLGCCGTCGGKNMKEMVCADCGHHIYDVPPADSEFSTEILGAFLEIRGREKGVCWTSEIIRDKEGSICDYVDKGSEEVEVSGRFGSIWSVEAWMAPHIVANYASVCESFGVECEEEMKKIIELYFKKKPPGYRIIEFPKANLIGNDNEGKTFVNGQSFTKEQIRQMHSMKGMSKNFGQN